MLKYFAVLFMVIDHINKILFNNEYYILTLIGRLAYPIFAYLAVYAYMFYTSDKLFYILRLLVFALLSQPFHMYGFDMGMFPLNILFSISLGLIALYSFERGYYYLLPIVSALSLWCDYSIFTIVLFFALYRFINEKSNVNILFFIVSLLILNGFEYMFYIPFFFLLLAYFEKKSLKITLNKYAFYIFYPFHFLILGVAR